MMSQIIYLIALLSKRGARAPKRKKTSSETKLKVSGHNQSMRKVLLLSLLVFLGNKIILLNQFPFPICFNAKLIEVRKAFALFDN